MSAESRSSEDPGWRRQAQGPPADRVLVYCTHSRDANIDSPGADKVSAVMTEGQPLIRGANSPLARLRSLLVRAPQSIPLNKDNCAWAEHVALHVELILSGSSRNVSPLSARRRSRSAEPA